MTFVTLPLMPYGLLPGCDKHGHSSDPDQSDVRDRGQYQEKYSDDYKDGRLGHALQHDMDVSLTQPNTGRGVRRCC